MKSVALKQLSIAMNDKITINLEGRNKPCAFFALYAGLMMYSEAKASQQSGNEFSIAGAEAFSILEDLKQSHPEMFSEAEAEYNNIYRPNTHE